METSTGTRLIKGDSFLYGPDSCSSFMLGVVNQHNGHAENSGTRASSNVTMACNQPLSNNFKKIDPKNAALQYAAAKLTNWPKMECKNILQEYTQKCKIPLPSYTTDMFGELHMPSFQASVKVAGTCYSGIVCKRKKLAEIEAAKAAIFAICSIPDESVSKNSHNHQKKCKRNKSFLQLMLHTQKRSRSWFMEMMLKT